VVALRNAALSNAAEVVVDFLCGLFPT
jgi:hypothetical protein